MSAPHDQTSDKSGTADNGVNDDFGFNRISCNPRLYFIDHCHTSLPFYFKRAVDSGDDLYIYFPVRGPFDIQIKKQKTENHYHSHEHDDPSESLFLTRAENKNCYRYYRVFHPPHLRRKYLQPKEKHVLYSSPREYGSTHIALIMSLFLHSPIYSASLRRCQNWQNSQSWSIMPPVIYL